MYLNKPNPKLCKYKNTTYFPSIQIFTAKLLAGCCTIRLSQPVLVGRNVLSAYFVHVSFCKSKEAM
jgi:hypothetical protein